MIYGQINHSWPKAIHDLSENNVHWTLNKHEAVAKYLFNVHRTLFFEIHFAPLTIFCPINLHYVTNKLIFLVRFLKHYY